MSGDVQPRKRREKKKKKEDGPEEVVFQHQPPVTTTSPSVTDDLNIHVQKEAHTGGGLCAKFVFFVLLTALTSLIGLIITEHRGLTDLNTIDTESRFAQLFDGWVDQPSLEHDESTEEFSVEHSEENLSEDQEEEDEEEDDEKEPQEDYSVEHDDDEDDEEASEENATDENETEEEYEDEEESKVQDDDTIENESEEVSNENDDENEDEQDEDEVEEELEEEELEYASEDAEKYEVSVEEQDEASLPTKEDATHEEEDEEEEEEVDDDDDKVDDEDYSEETVDKTETEESKYKSESKEAPDLTESEEITEQTVSEEVQASDHLLDDSMEKPRKKDVIERIDRDPIKKIHREPKEPVTKVRLPRRSEPESKKIVEETVETPDEPQANEHYNMVIKFGVGTALLVVAHVVLVQKWRTAKVTETKPQVAAAEEVESVTPDLSRRNTIVTPPSLQEIEQDIENIEEEYSEDEDDDSEEDSRSKPTRAKKRYQELQSTYSHTLSPEWEPKEARESRIKDYEEVDDEEEEGDQEELEGDQEYDDEISENEDEELLQRLEAKYGKIDHSEDEPDDNDAEEDDEAEDDDEEELEDDDKDEDFDSWKRVKVPSDDVPDESDSESEKNWSKEHSGAQSDFTNITNSEDWKIREELDRAQQNLANEAAYALTLFNKILERNPSSPRALYGKAQALDSLAEKKKSNSLLQQAIAIYHQVLGAQDVPDALFKTAADRCIDRMRFRGHYSQSVAIHQLLIDKFPTEVKFRNHLAVTYLTMSKTDEARQTLQETLLKWPNDGFALVHYGFILKTSDDDLEGAVSFMQRGIATKEAGVVDGRFYFHLGDALTRLGKTEEAVAVYMDGVENHVFRSKYQRSLYNVERLTAKPWWEKHMMPYKEFFKQLENNWVIIREEGLSILNKRGYFQPETENLRDVGDWKQFELFARGLKNHKNCKQCPITCKTVEAWPDAVGCRRGQIKFSVMHPGTHVWPHCGPTNCRLRVHLGLKVPLNTYIRVGEEIRSWEEGKLLIFDDSFEHEVWHNGTDTRLVLIIDIWHPELTMEEKHSLSSI